MCPWTKSTGLCFLSGLKHELNWAQAQVQEQQEKEWGTFPQLAVKRHFCLEFMFELHAKKPGCPAQARSRTTTDTGSLWICVRKEGWKDCAMVVSQIHYLDFCHRVGKIVGMFNISRMGCLTYPEISYRYFLKLLKLVCVCARACAHWEVTLTWITFGRFTILFLGQISHGTKWNSHSCRWSSSW